MSIKLRINGVHKNSELDIYNEGCDPDTSTQTFIDYQFQADNQKDLIAKVLEFFDAEGYEIDPCENDPSCFDFSVLECAEGVKASELEIELWKQGKENLYHCNYTCYVEIVKPFELVK